MTELSPQAQAVLDAAHDVIPDTSAGEVRAIAAALRAAAGQVAPETSNPNDTHCCPPVDTIVWKRLMNVRQQFFAIATELENHHG